MDEQFEEEREEHMTPEEMQRFINMMMESGDTYEKSLIKLARILDLHPFAGDDESKRGMMN